MPKPSEEEELPSRMPAAAQSSPAGGTPLRIAFLTTEYATEPTFYDGGIAQFVGHHSRGLAARGHSIEVFVIGDGAATYEADGVIVHRVPAVSRAVDFLHVQANRIFRHGWHESAHCLAVA